MKTKGFIDDLINGMTIYFALFIFIGWAFILYIMFNEIFVQLENWSNRILASILEVLLWIIIAALIVALFLFLIFYYNYRIEKTVYPRMTFKEFVKEKIIG